MAYSVDLRKKVVEYLERGHTQRKAARVFGIHQETVNKWYKKYRETGNLNNEPPRPRAFRKLDPEKLKAYINDHPDAYLYENGTL